MVDTIESLKAKIASYEQNGAAKLYYSLNRKMNEMADSMNKITLSTLSLDDKNDKTFERLKVIWNDAASISAAVKILGDSAGITQNEEQDINRKPFMDTIAVKRD